MVTEIIMRRTDNQLDREVEIPKKIINCPRYPGCLMNLYKPVSMIFWFSTFATEYVKNCFRVRMECILTVNPIAINAMPMAKKVFQGYTLPIFVAPMENDRA
jgi:hypothetical protein